MSLSLASSRSSDFSASSSSRTVSPSRVRCASVSDADLHREGADLIRRAFEAARGSEVADWRSMTSAVLKNRILDLTHPDRLADREGAKDFNAAYGPAAERIDAKERIWARASRTAYHGQGDCFVAGELLPEGMHWDVSGFGRGAILANAARVWKIKDPRSYLNIYPNGHVRPPSRRGASRVWPRKT